ncbi:hypothetical protein C8J57DRAFT_1507922 [Mycena rebaudengoi]|nr:hypothetical protein C8J57DRAFT_1507922 [Mycena rebaudengoi]
MSDGIHLLESLDWDPANADLTAYGDASGLGMGFYFPELGVAYQSNLPTNVPNKAKDQLRIFYFEAFQAQEDYIFNTLRTKPLYNEILKFSVDLLLAHGWQLRLLLLPTEDNVVADHLLRWENNKALLAYPGLLINSEILLPFIPFIPSQDVQREDEQ